MVSLIELIIGTCMIIIIWREILEPLLRALFRITATFQFLNYKSEPSDPAIRLFVPPHISPEDFKRLSIKERREIITAFSKKFHKEISEEVQREIQEGTLTDEMIFEHGKLFEPCDFCSPQDCDCTYEQYQAKMERMKRMEKEEKENGNEILLN